MVPNASGSNRHGWDNIILKRTIKLQLCLFRLWMIDACVLGANLRELTVFSCALCAWVCVCMYVEVNEYDNISVSFGTMQSNKCSGYSHFGCVTPGDARQMFTTEREKRQTENKSKIKIKIHYVQSGPLTCPPAQIKRPGFLVELWWAPLLPVSEA